MARYGSDKPDLRYGLELTELTSYLDGTEFRVFAGAIEAGGYVGAVVMPGGAAQTRKELDGWQDWAKARGAKGLAYVVLDEQTGEARGPVAKNLSEAHLDGLADAVGAKPGDAVFFAAAADRREAQELLGAARIEIARRAEPDRRVSLGVLLGGRRADVRAGHRRRRQAGRRLDLAAPPVHLAQRRVVGPVRPGAGRGAGLRVRHRLQRQRDRRRLHPYPPGRRAGPRVRRCSASRPRRRRTSSASCSRPSSTGRRRTAGSRWAGTGPACCWPGRPRSAR